MKLLADPRGFDPIVLGFVPLGNRIRGPHGCPPHRLVVWMHDKPHLFCRRCGRLLLMNCFYFLKNDRSKCGRASECPRCYSIRRMRSKRRRAELAEAAKQRPPPGWRLQGWESAMCF